MAKLATTPRISVITVVRNSKTLLEKTIASVVQQDYPDWEYIIVDGASTDGTVDVIQSAADRTPQLRWISEPDRGISDAFNKGIHLASGSWLNFLNAGDLFLHDRVLGQVSQYFPNQQIVTGFSRFGNSTIPEQRLSNEAPLHQRAKISHQASFIDRGVFERVGNFNEAYRIRMDYDFWLRSLQHYSFLMVDDCLVDYDEHGISGQGEYTKAFYEEEKRANVENGVPGCSRINALLNFRYYKDRTKRFLFRK